MDHGSTTCTRESLAAYLQQAYIVTPERAGELIYKNAEEVKKGISFMSMTYHVGDIIAEKEGLEGNPEYEMEEEEES